MKRLSILAIGLLLLPLFPACDGALTEPGDPQNPPVVDDPTPPPPGNTKTTLAVVPSALTVKIGGAYQLQAIINPQKGKNANTDQLVEWWSDDPTVATVSSKGRVRGMSFGTAMITARYEGQQAQAFVSVTDKLSPDDDESNKS